MHLPVNGYIISSSIDNFHDKSITIIHFQGWSWKLPIDSDGILSIAQPLHWCWLNLLEAKHALN